MSFRLTRLAVTSVLLVWVADIPHAAAAQPPKRAAPPVLTETIHKPKLVLKGHTHGVWGATYSPDGKQIATASEDRSVRLWDASTGEQVRQLDGHTGAAYCVSFSHDGKLLASGGHDRVVRIWDVATGDLVGLLEGHVGLVRSVAFTPDGRVLSGSMDTSIRVWDVEEEAQLARMDGHRDIVLCLAVSPDGKVAASGSRDKRAIVWDLKTYKAVWEVEPAKKMKNAIGYVKAVAFSPDGKQLYALGQNEMTRRWNWRTRKEEKVLPALPRQNIFALSPDGRHLVAFNLNIFEVVNTKTGEQPFYVMRWENGAPFLDVEAMAFSPDGRFFLAAPTGSGFEGRLRQAPDNGVRIFELVSPAAKP